MDLLNYQDAFSLVGAHTDLKASLAGVCKVGGEGYLCVWRSRLQFGSVGPECRLSALWGP